MSVFAIIPAAGQGKRFGSQKQFEEFSGKPILFYTLEAFEKAPSIDGIVVVVPEDSLRSSPKKINQASFKKVKKIVPGGVERQDSVRKGFESLPPCEWVVVHDGVRPMITVEFIERIITQAKKYGACVPGLSLKETIKKTDSDGWVQETIDRADLWGIQTPQVFRYAILQKAIQKAAKDNFLGTDEAMLVERIGEKIKIIEGEPQNIKITQPEDLAWLEFFLQREGKR